MGPCILSACANGALLAIVSGRIRRGTCDYLLIRNVGKPTNEASITPAAEARNCRARSC